MYSWKQRFSDWWIRVTQGADLSRPAWVHIGMAAGIALAVTGIILAIMVPGIRADISTRADRLASNLTGIRGQLQADYDELQAAVQQAIDDQWDDISDHLAHFDSIITSLTADLANLQADLAGLNQTGLSAYLAGGAGNYTMLVRSGSGGNFTANVHLAFSPMVGNLTGYGAALAYFYGGINWTLPGIPAYVCHPTFNGTTWGIADIWFNVGAFALVPGQESQLPITWVGLNSTWLDGLAYVDMFRIG